MQKRSCLLLIMILFLLAAPPAMFAASVQLSWQPNAEPDLQKYNVYYGTQSRSYGPPIPVDKSATHTLSGLDEGVVYYFAVSAVDNNDNESGFSEEISKMTSSTDTQPPVINITTPTSMDYFSTPSNSITIAGTASDDSNLQQITWTSSSTSSGTASGTESWSIANISLSEGQNTITVTATDAVGNQATDRITVTYTPPQTVSYGLFFSPNADRSNSADLENQAIAGELYIYLLPETNVSQVVYSLDGQTHNTETQAPYDIGLPFDTNTLSNGTHVISAQILLQDNTTLSVASTFTVQNEQVPPIDTAPPTVTITGPTTDSTYTSDVATISLAGTASDDSNLQQITWTSSSTSSGTASGTDNWSISGINLARGVQVITVTATDGDGNRSSDTLTVTYEAADTTAPTVEMTSPTTKTSYFSRTDTVAIGGKAYDDGGIAKVTWRNSRGESGVCSGTDNWQTAGIKLNRWWNTITVTAIDLAGNTDEYSLKVFRWK